MHVTDVQEAVLMYSKSYIVSIITDKAKGGPIILRYLVS